jgi:hypothetical protein
MMVLPAVHYTCIDASQPASYTDDQWLQITLPPLHRAGYGKTEALPYLDGNMRAEVVKAVFDFVHGTKKVLLSPSMSG